MADYRGHLTEEAYYQAGVLEVDKDIPEDHAIALLHSGRAVEVEVVKPVSEVKREPVKVSKRGGSL